MKSDLVIVIDTNVLFMGLEYPERKAGQILTAASEERISLVSPSYVMDELYGVLKRNTERPEWWLDFVLGSLPVDWYPEEIYLSFMEKAKIISHEPDRPLVALAMLLNCGILSANYRHFQPIKKSVKVWDIDDLLKEIKPV